MSNSDDSLPPSGPTLSEAFKALVTVFDERQINYAIIGGLATIQYTRVRTTDDIDALLHVPQLSLPGFLEALREQGFTVDLIRNIRELRDDGLTTITFGDVLVDLLRPVLPAYARVLDRAKGAQILGQTVRVSSPEGLIVMKLIAMRPQDEVDVRDLLNAYGDKLDLGYVRSELESFTEANDPRRNKFEKWVRSAVEASVQSRDER